MTLTRWEYCYGNAQSARTFGIAGRLAEVSDGTITYLMHTKRRSAAAMLRSFAKTAQYVGQVNLVGRIVDASGDVADIAQLTITCNG